MQKKPFLPPLLPKNRGEDADFFDMARFESLSVRAVAALAKLSGMMIASQKTDLFWLNWLIREAQASNVMEGTITTLDEILGENVGLRVAIERRDDVQEVRNYHEAMLVGMEQLKAGRDLSLSLIRELHAQLLAGARGQAKTPGKCRAIQVQIGRPPVYMPPEAIHIQALLEDLEAFMRRDDINPVMQAAIMHAQFEMIHPFCDGNGRLGRLLITLFLTQKNLLDLPCFYLSVYLQSHREDYYGSLDRISSRNDWNSWIKFFLDAVIKRSNENMRLLAAMINLYESSKNEFASITGSSHAVEILDYMFKNPLFTFPDMLKNSNIKLKQQALSTLMGKLERSGIIVKTGEKHGSRPAVWTFARLMDLIRQ